MTAATEERIRACLVGQSICGAESAANFAAVLAEEIEEGDAGKVTEDRLAAAVAELNASIERLGRDFAERNLELAETQAKFLAEMHELERQRDERERQRDERERERQQDWEAFQRRIQTWGYVLFGLWLASVSALVAVIALAL